MSVRRLAAKQPDGFEFSPENREWVDAQLKKYPNGREQSAVLPLLWRAQEQCDGWLPEPAIRYVAELLNMPYIRVYEVATFYTMFNLEPVGKYLVQVCKTTPCWLRGSDELERICFKEIGKPEGISSDGNFTWRQVECLGACVNAPVVQINADFHEDLNAQSFGALLSKLRVGETVAAGSHAGRHASEPVDINGHANVNDGQEVLQFKKTE